MKGLRENVVRGRLAGALVGLMGVVLALPMVVLPTHAVGLSAALTGTGSPDFLQSFWSWGRYADTTPSAEAAQFDVANTVGLVLFVLALVVGGVGATTYAFRAGAEGSVVGGAGLAWAACEVVGGLGRRVGDGISGLYGDAPGLTITTFPAGVLQVVSAVMLVAALGVVVSRPLVALARDGVTRLRELARRGAAEDEAAGETQDRPVPRVGIATIRDVPPGSRGGGQPSGTRWGGSPSGVGFSDTSPDAGGDTRSDAGRDGQAGGTRPDPGPDSGRFRPPR